MSHIPRTKIPDFESSSPNPVRYRTNNEAKGVLFGAALHCIPTGKGKSRLMFRTYFKLPGLMIKIILALKPMWFRHLGSMTILEQAGPQASTLAHTRISRPRARVD